VDAFVLANRSRLGQLAGAAIDPAMHAAPLDGIGRLRPLPLDPFEIGQPRALLKLVDHPRRHIGLVVPERQRRQGQLRLEVHRIRPNSGISRVLTVSHRLFARNFCGK